MKREERSFYKEGKGKIFYQSSKKNTLIQYFKDDLTAFNKKKTSSAEGKGILNNRISAFFFTHVEKMGIPNHFLKILNMREQLVKQLEMLPLEITIRNYAAGDIVKRLGLEYGSVLPRPLLEFRYKSDTHGDPLVSEEYVNAFGWASSHEMDEMISFSYRLNDFLTGVFLGVEIQLVDFKLEFGRFYESETPSVRLMLADEITPDSCRLWDLASSHPPGHEETILDKDRFRKNMGGVMNAYQEVARRLGVLPKKHQKYTQDISSKGKSTKILTSSSISSIKKGKRS